MRLDLLDRRTSSVATVVLPATIVPTVVVGVRCLGAMPISPFLSQGTHRIVRSRSSRRLTIELIKGETGSVLANDRTIVGRMLVVMTVVTVVMIEMIAVTAIVPMMAVTVVVTVLEMTVIVPRLVVRPVRPRIVRGQPIVVPHLAGQMFSLKSMKPRLRWPC